MSHDDVLTILNFIDQAPTDMPATLRQGDVLVRYAQPGSPATHLIRRDAEMLLALAPHGLPGSELLELDLGAFRVRYAFSLQRLTHADSVPIEEGDGESVWQQLGEYLQRLHTLPMLSTGVLIPSPDPRQLLLHLNETQIITDKDLVWLDRWIKTLQLQAGPERPATLHGALRPVNVRLSRDRQQVVGLTDWSRSHAGDAARDFIHLPLSAYAALCPGDDARLAAGLLAFLTQLLLDLRDAAQSQQALPAAIARLLNLFQFNFK